MTMTNFYSEIPATRSQPEQTISHRMDETTTIAEHTERRMELKQAVKASTKRPQSFYYKWCRVVFLFVCLSKTHVLAAEEAKTCETNNGECKNPEADSYDKHADKTSIRMVTREELALHNGEPTEANNHSKSIWLSILGEVYDVTKGRQYYAKGAGYSGMSAKDCSLCFVSGTFTQEEGDKDTSEIPFDQLPPLLDWRNFYADHKTYEFVGYLLDDRYYDENAKPTPKMLDLRDRVKEALVAAEIKKAERAKKREEMKKKREEEKKQKEAAAAAAAKQ